MEAIVIQQWRQAVLAIIRYFSSHCRYLFTLEVIICTKKTHLKLHLILN